MSRIRKLLRTPRGDVLSPEAPHAALGPGARTVAPAAPVVAVLLAAGRATRFGSDKLTSPLGGRPLVLHAADALRRAVERGALQGRLAVVEQRDTSLAALLEAAGLTLVEAPDAKSGFAHSLRAGIAAADQAVPPGPAALVVALGDQPDIDPAVIEALVARWRATGADAVRPRYSGEPDVPGHPVLLDRRLWPQAWQLAGDSGLGPLLHGGKVRLVLVDTAGRNPDIDTRADLAARDDLQESDRCD